jgi:hypothetical protein
MAYLCSQWKPNVQIKYFMFDWSIYTRFVLNRGWKRDSLWMIFVNICSTWSIVELKTRFEAWISINDVNVVSLINLSYLITLMVYLCSQWEPNVQIKYFMFDWSIYRLFALKRGWKRDSPNNDIPIRFPIWSIVALKSRFESWITRNEVNGVCFTFFI